MTGDICSMVIADVEERRRVGMERYGVPLRPRESGRDMLREAYEEALDLVVYLRCALEERDGGAA